jgi:YD repeat-containing protein
MDGHVQRASDGVRVVGISTANISSKAFHSFSFAEQLVPAWIDENSKFIYLAVEDGTDLTDLVATFTLSTGAMAALDGIPQISGVTSNDFSNPLSYTVTAWGESTSVWTVTVDSETAFIDKFLATLGQAIQCTYFGDPVNVATGNFIDSHTDISVPTRGVPLEFTRSYNSLDDTSGPLGRGWQHNYNTSLTVNDDDSVSLRYAAAKVAHYVYDNGAYLRPAGTFETLARNIDDIFTLTFKDQTKYIYDQTGRLSLITDKNGNTNTLTYDGSLLTAITDPVGRSLELTYDNDDRLAGITDPDDRSVGYAYDLDGNLATVVGLNGGTTTYEYNSHGLVRGVVKFGLAPKLVIIGHVNKMDSFGNNINSSYLQAG